MPLSSVKAASRWWLSFCRISSESVPDLGTLDIPEALSRALERAMARDAADRPASAGEFGEELCDIGRRIGFGVDEMALVEATEDSLLAGTGSWPLELAHLLLRRSSDGAADPGDQGFGHRGVPRRRSFGPG